MAFKFNADLVNDVALRRIVVFVGAGVSKWATPVDGGSFKDWPEFLRHANSKVSNRAKRKVIEEQIVERDYLMASELLKSALDHKWTAFLSEEFQKAAGVSRLHKALIDLKPRIVITTNFDKLIENAWNDAPGGYYPNVLSTVDSSVFKLFRDDGNYLLKIHGSIDTPSGIVFDKSSYQRDAFSNRYYADLLSTLLLTHTFIFVGFSMSDPAISLIVEGAAYRFPDTRPHYIFQSGSAISDVDGLWKKLRKLYVLRYSAADHHLALALNIEALAKAGAERRTEVAAANVGTIAKLLATPRGI